MVETETRWARPPEEVIPSVPPPSVVPSPDRHLRGDNDFFRGRSLADLAREQGVGPVRDFNVFAGVIPDDEDIDEMLAEIYRLREP
jgi:hypothetical protein